MLGFAKGNKCRLPPGPPRPTPPTFPHLPTKFPAVTAPVCPALDNELTFRTLGSNDAPSLGAFARPSSNPPNRFARHKTKRPPLRIGDPETRAT